MKKNLFISILSVLSIITVLGFSGCSKSEKKAQDSKEVTVYTYDSFAGEWGPAAEIAQKFTEETGYTVNFVDCGDAVQAYTRALQEKDNAKADVILGIDNILASSAVESGLLEEYMPKDADKIIPEEIKAELGEGWYLTPFDYSHFAMIYDTESSVPCPSSLADLTSAVYEKKIILMDPRTSTPGLGFLAWTVSEFGTGEELENFWKELKPNVLTMTSGWSEGWGMFLEGEAPLCISYTTSPAYNVEYEDEDRYAAVIFAEGHVQQVEGYGLIKNAPHKEAAEAFMDFMISEAAQNALPLTQWMYPVNKNVVLPESYNKAAPVPEITLPTDSEAVESVLDKVISILGK